MSTAPKPASLFAVVAATVSAVESLDPVFQRLTLTLEKDATMPVERPALDQRIKMAVPSEPSVAVALPEGDFRSVVGQISEDPHLRVRTVSVRAWRRSPKGYQLVVDVALHEGTDCGPLARFAAAATVGDRCLLMVPRGDDPGSDDPLTTPAGGVEFAPGAARRCLLVGDETALPAIARIVEDCAELWPHLQLSVLGTCPEQGNPEALLNRPVQATWLRRGQGEDPSAVLPALRTHTAVWLGRGGDNADGCANAGGPETEAEQDVHLAGNGLLWETPRFSAASQAPEDAADGADVQELFIWIAGESTMVTQLRRFVVRECHVPRSSVAFMGYWKRGTAMKG